MARPKKKTSSEDNDGSSVVSKSKTLFDHVNQIRNTKSTDYFEKLTEQDKKSFNHYMICRFLSMDASCIYEASYLSKVFDKMDSKSFYKVCCAIIPNARYTPYIKSSRKKINSELVGYIVSRFQVGSHEAEEYYRVLVNVPTGLETLREICRSYGRTDKEIERIIDEE
jgi:hypothetical protein